MTNIAKHRWVVNSPIVMAVWKPGMLVPVLRWHVKIDKAQMQLLVPEMAKWVGACKAEAAKLEKENENVDM